MNGDTSSSRRGVFMTLAVLPAETDPARADDHPSAPPRAPWARPSSRSRLGRGRDLRRRHLRPAQAGDRRRSRRRHDDRPGCRARRRRCSRPGTSAAGPPRAVARRRRPAARGRAGPDPRRARRCAVRGPGELPGPAGADRGLPGEPPACRNPRRPRAGPGSRHPTAREPCMRWSRPPGSISSTASSVRPADSWTTWPTGATRISSRGSRRTDCSWRRGCSSRCACPTPPRGCWPRPSSSRRRCPPPGGSPTC